MKKAANPFDNEDLYPDNSMTPDFVCLAFGILDCYSIVNVDEVKSPLGKVKRFHFIRQGIKGNKKIEEWLETHGIKLSKNNDYKTNLYIEFEKNYWAGAPHTVTEIEEYESF